MSLIGKKVFEVEIKSDGDVFHELFRYNPHNISKISPDHIQGCELHEGQWGTPGSIIEWNYVLDGKPQVSKQVVEAIDEENRSITFKPIGGDLMEIYKTFKGTVHVNTVGENNLVTWIIEYEKMNEDVPDPDSLMEVAYKITKDVEAHHLQVT